MVHETIILHVEVVMYTVAGIGRGGKCQAIVIDVADPRAIAVKPDCLDLPELATLYLQWE